VNTPVLLLCLLDLALIGGLPRFFFRPGRLNARWWATAAPFFAAAALVAASLAGWIEPISMSHGLTAATDISAAMLAMTSFGLMWWTIGTHQRPVRLWHQERDTPDHLVRQGAYARVRHPFYSAFLLALLACALAVPHILTAGVFAYAFLRLNHTAAGEERRFLASALAAEYREYMARAGRFWPRPSISTDYTRLR
jgi:protein-S-isoprenylcysteine O-methyltransferase Ste14